MTSDNGGRRDGARMSSHWKSDVAEQEQLATRGQCGDIVLSKPETIDSLHFDIQLDTTSGSENQLLYLL